VYPTSRELAQHTWPWLACAFVGDKTSKAEARTTPWITAVRRCRRLVEDSMIFLLPIGAELS
jgi:hypothetical protein